MSYPQWHQSGSMEPQPSNGAYQTFNEPIRYLDDPDASQEELLGLPKWAVSTYFRARNIFSLYNFFFIYCLNAFLNVEIWREYMETHGTDINSLYRRSWFENFYIATLAAPLVDVIVRCLARNFLKLNLAKAQSHVGWAASLAICTPSLNAYAFLVMRRNAKTIILVMLLDLLELIYSLYMWTLQPVKSEALWMKLILIVIGSIFWVYDLVLMISYRRFFKPLPPHFNPIFVCWDVNHSFHWHSANNTFDILERHEDPNGPTFTSMESIAVRKRIAAWNQGEEEIATFSQPPTARQPADGNNSGIGMNGSGDVDEDEDDLNSEAEHQSLLASRR